MIIGSGRIKVFTRGPGEGSVSVEYLTLEKLKGAFEEYAKKRSIDNLKKLASEFAKVFEGDYEAAIQILKSVKNKSSLHVTAPEFQLAQDTIADAMDRNK